MPLLFLLLANIAAQIAKTSGIKNHSILHVLAWGKVIIIRERPCGVPTCTLRFPKILCQELSAYFSDDLYHILVRGIFLFIPTGVLWSQSMEAGMAEDLVVLGIRIDSDGVVEASQNFEKLEKTTDGAVKATDRFKADMAKVRQELTTANAATKRLEEDIRKLQKEMETMSSSMQRMEKTTSSLGRATDTLWSAARMAAIVKVVTGIISAAARYETLGVVVHQVGKAAGYSAVEIDKNVSTLRRLGIDGQEARKTTTQLIQSQVSLAKATELARVAQDAAVIGNINSSEAFQRLVQGIQNANIQTLRTIGINVNFEQSYRKLAVELGKTLSALTEQEKTQARVNAVLEVGPRIAGAYEAAMGTLGKQISSLDRIWLDFFTDFGASLLEVSKATGIISLLTKAIEGLNALVLARRGMLAGSSFSEITDILRTEGLQGARDFVEGMNAARESTARLETQLKGLAAIGIDVSVISSRRSMRPLRPWRRRTLPWLTASGARWAMRLILSSRPWTHGPATPRTLGRQRPMRICPGSGLSNPHIKTLPTRYARSGPAYLRH